MFLSVSFSSTFFSFSRSVFSVSRARPRPPSSPRLHRDVICGTIKTTTNYISRSKSPDSGAARDRFSSAIFLIPRRCSPGPRSSPVRTKLEENPPKESDFIRRAQSSPSLSPVSRKFGYFRCGGTMKERVRYRIRNKAPRGRTVARRGAARRVAEVAGGDGFARTRRFILFPP